LNTVTKHFPTIWFTFSLFDVLDVNNSAWSFQRYSSTNIAAENCWHVTF
jgi:hypothetical protein